MRAPTRSPTKTPTNAPSKTPQRLQLGTDRLWRPARVLPSDRQRSYLLAFQIVRVFPHDQSQNRPLGWFGHDAHERIVLIGHAHNGPSCLCHSFACGEHDDQDQGHDDDDGHISARHRARPRQIGRCGGNGKERLECGSIIERCVNEGLQLGRRSRLIGGIEWSHDGPKEAVIVVTATILSNGRDIQSIAHQVQQCQLQWLLLLGFGSVVGGLVEIHDGGTVMLVMMQAHGGFVDERFEGILRVGQVGEFVFRGLCGDNSKSGFDRGSNFAALSLLLGIGRGANGMLEVSQDAAIATTLVIASIHHAVATECKGWGILHVDAFERVSIVRFGQIDKFYGTNHICGFFRLASVQCCIHIKSNPFPKQDCRQWPGRYPICRAQPSLRVQSEPLVCLQYQLPSHTGSLGRIELVG
jgi:hypothetical protein